MKDIIVVGGGIAGVSAAARLSENFSVTLLEAERNLAYHASGRSAAAFIGDYGNKTIRDLNKASENFLHTENGGVLSKRGLLMIANQKQKNQFELESNNFGLQGILVHEACKKIPIIDNKVVSFAAFRPDVYDLDTDLPIQNFLKTALRNDVEVVTDSRVSKIESNKNTWTLISSDKEYKSKIIVNAAGAWADQIATLASVKTIGLKALKRSMVRIPAPANLNVRTWPFLFGTNEDWYARPDAGQLLISPSEEQLSEPHDAWAEDLVLAAGINRYEKFVTEKVKTITSNWAGLRTFAPDRALVIGFDKRIQNFFWLAGQGGYGFQTAVAASQLTKDLIMGETSELNSKVIKTLSPTRFG